MDTERMLGLGKNNNIIDKIKNNEPINVLSLFDGISCGQLALKRANIKVNNYYSSEIDRNAISITQYHYPNTIQLGDINNWKQWEINNKINLKQ